MIRVLLNSVDITANISASSLEKIDQINERADTAKFLVRRIQGVELQLGDNVQIDFQDSTTDGWVIIFAGNILKISQEPIQRLDIVYEVECQDYGNEMGAKLVNTRYDDMLAGDIVKSIVNLFCPGFTVTAVEDGPTIASIAFERVPVNEAIQKLAELTNYSWYVDYERDVHFFAISSEAAPFDLDESSGNFVWDSLKIAKDYSQVRNRVIVRGGLERADTERTETFTTSTVAAERNIYRLANKFDTITSIKVNSVEQTVGIEGINDDADFEVMWSFTEKFARFTSGHVPASGDTVEVTGVPLLPIIVSVQDNDSIAALAYGDFDGVFEYFIKDVDIKSQAEALQRAQSELDAYARDLVEGEFRTMKYGLRSGQTIHIEAQDIDADFIIQRVRFVEKGPDVHEWVVSIASLKTVGIVEVLQKLLRKKTLSAGDGEILLSLLTMADPLAMTDDTPAITETSPPYEIGTDAIIGFMTIGS